MNAINGKFRRWFGNVLVLVFVVSIAPSLGLAQSAEEQTVQSARVVLDEALSSRMGNIPASMLADCHGVAIVPNVIKGGFIVGARHGKGLLIVRDANGVWHAPVFITLTGGNIGWQAGIGNDSCLQSLMIPLRGNIAAKSVNQAQVPDPGTGEVEQVFAHGLAIGSVAE